MVPPFQLIDVDLFAIPHFTKIFICFHSRLVYLVVVLVVFICFSLRERAILLLAMYYLEFKLLPPINDSALGWKLILSLMEAST
jgi:hypothetical protein